MLRRALISVPLMLTAAVICGGAAGADPDQDAQFLALLNEKQIPALDNTDGLIGRAHEICGELDNGVVFPAVVDEEMNIMYGGDPSLHLMADRVTRTAVRFITASVEVYCPQHRG